MSSNKKEDKAIFLGHNEDIGLEVYFYEDHLEDEREVNIIFMLPRTKPDSKDIN